MTNANSIVRETDLHRMRDFIAVTDCRLRPVSLISLFLVPLGTSMYHEGHAAEPRAEAARRAGVRIQPRPARDSLFRRWRKRIISLDAVPAGVAIPATRSSGRRHAPGTNRPTNPHSRLLIAAQFAQAPCSRSAVLYDDCRCFRQQPSARLGPLVCSTAVCSSSRQLSQRELLRTHHKTWQRSLAGALASHMTTPSYPTIGMQSSLPWQAAR